MKETRAVVVVQNQMIHHQVKKNPRYSYVMILMINIYRLIMKMKKKLSY
eukprot:UN11671